MPSESIKPSPQPQSLETLQKTFKQRLDTILNKQLTIENIETFADITLSETIQLTEDILKEYRNNPKFNTGLITLNKQEQENEAFKILEIKDIDKILQSIIDKKEQIDSLKTYININAENIDRVITPPQENNGTKIEAGTGNLEKKKMFPRLLTLFYILEHDFEIMPSPENIPIKEGIVTDQMMRQAPYVRVEIPDLERVAYICDEEGNVSYIFDITKLTEKGLILEALDLEDKGDKNSLIAKYPGIGVRIIQTKNWKNQIATALQEEIPEIQMETIETDSAEIRSEFREKKQLLPFDKFQVEVRSLYSGQGDIQKWYRKEKRQYFNWPYTPSKTYKNKGWTGWSELVDKENRLKKEWLPFDRFQAEVINLFPKTGDVKEWYCQEQKNHKNWPFNPRTIYKDKGWIGWPEIVGKENRLKKEYIQFENFQTEVRNLYSGQKNVEKWYWLEQKNHKNWPAVPNVIYKDKGWIGWPELVGKENFLKREFLPFEEFQNEVMSLYPGEGGIEKWYWLEQKNHKNWPAAPSVIYKEKGWIGYMELVGKENPFKKK